MFTTIIKKILMSKTEQKKYITDQDWDDAANRAIMTNKERRRCNSIFEKSIYISENKNVDNENKKEKIMDKSYYCKLAEMLGVELNKNFYIGDDREHRYKITKYGFHVINNDSMFYEDASLNDLLLVFKGEEEIIKNEMWIPENDEKYFVSDLLNSDLIHEYTWRGDEFDCNMYDRGLIFKTKEEAIKMSKKMLAMLKERRNLA